MKSNLNSFIHNKMDVLFLALNPPIISNNNGHYFSRVKTFWDILSESGLIEHSNFHLNQADEIIFGENYLNYKKKIFGITDLVHHKVETKSSKVKPTVEDFKRIINIIDTLEINTLVLMHSSVIKCFEKHNIIEQTSDYGFVGNYKKTKIYKVPFPTGSSLPKDFIVEQYSKILNSFTDED
jgi:hypothetical protein